MSTIRAKFLGLFNFVVFIKMIKNPHMLSIVDFPFLEYKLGVKSDQNDTPNLLIKFPCFVIKKLQFFCSHLCIQLLYKLLFIILNDESKILTNPKT